MTYNVSFRTAGVACELRLELYVQAGQRRGLAQQADRGQQQRREGPAHERCRLARLEHVQRDRRADAISKPGLNSALSMESQTHARTAAASATAARSIAIRRGAVGSRKCRLASAPHCVPSAATAACSVVMAPKHH